MNVEGIKIYCKAAVEKIKNNKKIFLILIVGLAGILLITLDSFDTKRSDDMETYQEPTQKVDFDVYEEKLEAFLENINGVSGVDVMLTFDSSAESVYAVDSEQSESNADENKLERKYKYEHIIVKNGSQENGLKQREIYPKVRGVAVICVGGNNPIIKEQIVSAVSALFDINSNQISVASKA